MALIYRGVSLLSSAEWTPPGYGRENAITPVFGRDGLPFIDGGGRGGESSAEGVVWAAGPTLLGASLGTLRGLNDGQAGDLTDPFGVDWPDVVLTRVRAVGRVIAGPDGTYGARVRLDFLHLS